MELCSLEDAFPDIKNSTDKSERSRNDISGPSREERRAARKKAKKCKGPPLAFLNAQDDMPDADRPALKRVGEIPAFVSIEDAYKDLSENSFEGFKMPCLPTSNATFTDAGLPEYFGQDDDDDIKGFAQKDGFATMLDDFELRTNTSESLNTDDNMFISLNFEKEGESLSEFSRSILESCDQIFIQNSIT